MHIQFILYVANQELSTDFYEKLLGKEPVLLVKGITEFQLNKKTKLGLMPNNGIAKIFPKEVRHPKTGTLIPRCELYLAVDDVELFYRKALNLGAKAINPPKQRDWGDFVGYVMDRDGHIIAFYKNII